MHISNTAVALAMLFLAGWCIGAVLVLVNPVLISLLRVSPKLKGRNFGLWALYVILGGILLLGAFDKIPLPEISFSILLGCGVVIPCMAISHFALLIWMLRKPARDI